MQLFQSKKFLPKEEIERIAINVLNRVQARRKRPLRWPIDATVIAEALGLDVEWFGIPADREGEIAAMILPLERKIVINENIPGLKGGFEQSTVAHEIGHWILHINQDAVGTFVERLDASLELPVEPFLCRSATNQNEKIEWQAQYFAGCLLMPRFQLEEACRGRDITQWKYLYPMANELGVTISNLVYRLKDMGWIQIPRGSRQIYPGEAFPSLG